MSETYIFEGKTTNEAIENGLKKLKVYKNDVEIKVIEEEKRSFFNILEKRNVKIEMKLKEKNNLKEERIASRENLEEALVNINNFLDKWLPTISNKQLSYETKITNDYIEVEIKGEEINYLIGYRGEVLNSLQVIISSVAGKNIEGKIRISIDISGYKIKREKILTSLAEKEAKRVEKTKKSSTLEPMTAYERKIIHTALQNHPRVATKSIGEGSNRRIVIYLK